MPGELFRSGLRRALCLLLLLAWLAPPHAEAQSHKERKQAEQHFKQGRVHFEAGRFDDAIHEYLAAHELVPEPVLLFNVALAYRAKGDHDWAATYFERYLALDPDGPGAAEARETLAAIQREQDAATAERRRIEEERAAAERRRIEEERATAERRRIEEERAAAERRKLGKGAAAAAAGRPPRQAGRRGGRGLRIAGLTTMVLGAAAVGFGVKYGLDAGSISDELSATDRWTEARLARIPEGDEAEQRMFVLTSAGGAAMVVGGVLYWLGARSASVDGAAPAPAAALGVAPIPTSSGLWLSLSAAF
jgi:tetratricopeptide (TPR) repeat protein